ncbi:hypothetical protein SLS62_008619 [Diatrype stigma]|uniref:Uncharacterized protein n=1 Tax=Diatrype stigma TaxID=117547 RepID=A0AAN9YL91_9PEZI
MLHPAQNPFASTTTAPSLAVAAAPSEAAGGGKAAVVVPAAPPRQWAMGAEAFNNVMPHHDGIAALWETKWKFPCSKAVYPFHDGAYEDFEPVFRGLIERGEDLRDGTSPAYTRAFLPVAEALERRGDEAVDDDPGKASALYLRAACVLRIARFPYICAHPGARHRDPDKWDAWERQKRVYMKAARTWDAPVEEVRIPHVFRQGVDGDSIPAYVRVPAAATAAAATAGNQAANGGRESNGSGGNKNGQDQEQKHPVVVLLTGLDGYRPDNTTRCDEFLARGWATIVVEIPGTADSPADPSDPASGDRVLDSVFAFLDEQPGLDAARVLLWGLSAGGYHAVRAAHTHRARLRGVVAQGAGVHHFLDRDWLARADGHEYPFALTPAFAAKHGYGHDGAGEFVEDAQRKFSLLELGVVQGPATRLLLINGTLDGLMPIEDSMMLFEYGTPKEARFFPGALHMGYPMANASVYPWMEEVMASK